MTKTDIQKWKPLIIYGVFMGILLILMQIINYKTVIRDLRLEIYGMIIAILFLALGIWLGSKGIIRKKKTSVQNNFNLSDREKDVLKLISQGLTNKEIAERLYLSPNTIKTHTSNIYSKLGVERRSQAIQIAMQNQLV